jgi:flagellar basal-body rod protein FlgB
VHHDRFPHPNPLPEGEGDGERAARDFHRKISDEMTISIDSALGIHPTALALRARRAELLSSNLANADTPGFKAKDMDFSAILRQGQDTSLRLTTTHPDHTANDAVAGPSQPKVLYRIPNQPSMDGNSVDPHLEKAAFAENALRYQTSLMLLELKVRGLMTAIRGE